MLRHEYFEELAALAAIGQISGSEMGELEKHLENCAGCRTAYADFAEIAESDLPMVGDRPNKMPWLRTRWGADREYRQRFVGRARAEGIRFSPDVDSKFKRRKTVWITFTPARAAVFLLASFSLVIGVWTYLSRVPSKSVVEPESALRQQVAQLAVSNTQLGSRLKEMTKLEVAKNAEFQQLERQRDGDRGRLAAMERELERVQRDKLVLQAQLSNVEAQASELKTQSQESARLVGDLKIQLDRAVSSQTASEATLAGQQDRIRELSERLAAQTVLFERERELLAAGKEIRNLMGARNLHIIDVFDVDGRGRNAKEFGRVFYTEGKSLIFYAFDLAPRRFSRAGHAFQAWGYRDPTPQSARSLGIFFADDKTQNRWVLKFDDPEVLAQIDSVFVTVEPPGGSPKPTGQKLMYAYLNGQPNHP